MKTRVLDFGYVELIDAWGRDLPAGITEPGDEAIICGARMSTGKGFLGWKPDVCPVCEGEKRMPELNDPSYMCDCYGCDGRGTVAGDEKLLRYLYTEVPKHTTPFEMCGMTVEVQAPIFIFREWHRHRTQSYNEASARYAPLPNLNYIPTVERLMLNSKSNKQAGTVKGAEELTEEGAQRFRMELEAMYQQQERFYQNSLEAGVPKELARIDLPVGRYSKMRASANLLNWLKFMTLRSHHKAMWEIQQFSNAVGELVAEKFPRTWELFCGER